MVYAGTVQGGVIVLENGVQLPEGQSVSVSPVETPKKSGNSILDIPTMSVGEVREGGFVFDREAIYDEMLEDRI